MNAIMAREKADMSWITGLVIKKVFHVLVPPQGSGIDAKLTKHGFKSLPRRLNVVFVFFAFAFFTFNMLSIRILTDCSIPTPTFTLFIEWWFCVLPSISPASPVPALLGIILHKCPYFPRDISGDGTPFAC